MKSSLKSILKLPSLINSFSDKQDLSFYPTALGDNMILLGKKKKSILGKTLKLTFNKNLK